MPEPFSFLTKLAIGAGGVTALLAAVAEAVPPQVIEKATPTPWELIGTGVTAGVGILLARYMPPEKKIDQNQAELKAQHALLGRKLDSVISQTGQISIKVGAIDAKLEGLDKRLDLNEQDVRALKHKTGETRRPQ